MSIETRRVLFGWPRDGSGSLVHGVIDSQLEGGPSLLRLPDGELVDVVSGHPAPDVRRAVAICGRRGGTFGMWQVTPHEVFSPQGTTEAPRREVCPACTRIWSTTFAADMPGWDKACAECGHTKNISQFRTDRRTRDGASSACEDCHRLAADARKATEAVIRAAARDHARNEGRRRTVRYQVEALSAWQSTPWLATFTCTSALHVLRPDVEEFTQTVQEARRSYDQATNTFLETQVEALETVVRPIWRCACGSAPVEPGVPSAAVRLLQGGDKLMARDLGPVAVSR